MLQTILVPLDGSDRANLIFLPLRRILDASEVKRLVLLHVEQEGQDEDQREAGMAKVQDLVPKTRVLVDVRVEQGDPTERILACAEELNPDLIAMSTHGRSGMERWVRGSVAERVLRHARTPLLLCNPYGLVTSATLGPHFTRILVPLDGSDQSYTILPLVTEVANAHGAEVVLLVVENVHSPGGFHLAPLSVVKVAASMEPYRVALEESGVTVHTVTATGDAAHEILAAAEHERADLVAICTHGRSGPSRWMFGSVAEKVLRSCRLPLLVRRVVE